MSSKTGFLLIVPIVLAAAVGCTAAPTAPNTDLSKPFDSLHDRPFYYYDGDPIYLEVVPESLSFAGTEAAPGAARTLLAGLGLVVGDVRPLPQAPGHYVLELGGANAESAQRAATVLRMDPRFEFAAAAFRTSERSEHLLLLNRIAVQFKPGVSSAQVISLARSLDMRVIRIGTRDHESSLLAYPSRADPLRVSHALYQHPLVLWADPDKLTNIRIGN